MTKISTFTCAICEVESTKICVQCTKDTCANHLCEKCGACSDCCSCEVKLDEVKPDDARPAEEAAADTLADSPETIA